MSTHTLGTGKRTLQQVILLAFSFIVLLSVLMACARKDYGKVQQNQSSRQQQQLYKDLHAPLRAGHKLLEELLPKAKAVTVVFELRQSGARKINRTLTQADLWNENLAIFFLTPKVRKTGYDLFYFDPRALRIQQVKRRTYGMQQDIIHSIVRSVPVRRKPTFTQNELDVFQYNFINNPETGLNFYKHKRLTDHIGNNIMPVMLPEHNAVVYTSIDHLGNKRVMQVPLLAPFDDPNKAPQSTALIPNPNIQSTHPRILSDGSLGLFANPDGYFRAYEYNLQTRAYRPTNKEAAGADNGDLILTNLRGKDTPLVFKLPEKLNLETIMGLVKAHNNGVNRYRALLAASLIQARRSKLKILPNFQFGVYYTPVSNIASGNNFASGDFLTEGISRGLFGIVQDLLSIPKHLAMSEAQIVQAEIARDTLLDEINKRQAEAADLFFQAQLYQQLLDIDKTLLDIVRQQEKRQKNKRQHGVAISAEVMGFEITVTEVEKRLDDHQRRFDLLMDEIKDICSLPRSKNIVLDTEIYYFEKDKLETFRELRQMAIMNNPRIKASRLQLNKAFFERQTGSRLDPSLNVGASYGRSHEEFGEFVDEFITLNVNSSIPIGAIRDFKLHRNYWQEIQQALHLEQEQQTQKTLRMLKNNLHSFYDSRNSFEVQQQHLAHALEQIRLARIFKRYPLVKTAYKTKSKNLPESRQMYYQALTETLRQHASLAQYYTRIWRDMGLSESLPKRLKPISRESINKHRFSTWIWNARELLTADNAIDSFIKAAHTNQVRRAYVYLEADDKVLSDPLMSERLTMLINKGARYDINVWALVGNKDEKASHMESQIHNSARNIEKYNKRFKYLEPRVGGMKVHLPQAGSSDITDQKQYQRVLEQTRALLPNNLPLWIDVPLNAFTEENAHYIKDVLHLVDGVTVYNPKGKNQELLIQADTLLELSPKTIEFAVKHNSKEDGASLNRIIKTLHKHQIDKHNFAGIALLDWSHILRNEEELEEEDE